MKKFIFATFLAALTALAAPPVPNYKGHHTGVGDASDFVGDGSGLSNVTSVAISSNTIHNVSSDTILIETNSAVINTPHVITNAMKAIITNTVADLSLNASNLSGTIPNGSIPGWVASGTDVNNATNFNALRAIGLGPAVAGITYAKEYGATPDGVVLDDVSITNGVAKVYSAKASWTVADQGKSVILYTNLATVFSFTSEAGNNVSNVVYGPLLTTIATVEDGQHCTLAANSLGTVIPTRMVYGTDNSTPIQAAINHVVLTNWGGELQFERGIYVCAGAIQEPAAQNAVLVIPAFNTNQTYLTMRGVGNSFGYYTGYNPTYVSTNGTVLFCGTGGSTNYPALIGVNIGAVTNYGGTQLPAPNGSPWSSVALNLQGIQFTIPANSTVGILNALFGGGIVARDCVFMSDFWGAVTTRANTMAPTSTNAFGVLCPGSANNGQNIFENCWFLGLYVGLRTGDHTAVRDSMLASSHVGIGNPYLGGHVSVDNVALQANKYGVAGLLGVLATGGIGGDAIFNDLWIENNQVDFQDILCAKVSYLSSFEINIVPSLYARSIDQWWRPGGANPSVSTMTDVKRDVAFKFSKSLSDNYFGDDIARFYSSETLDVYSNFPLRSVVSMSGTSNTTQFGWNIVDDDYGNGRYKWAWMYDRGIPGIEWFNWYSNYSAMRISDMAARDTLTMDSTAEKLWNETPARSQTLSNQVLFALYPSNYTVGCQFTANANMNVTALGVWCQTLTNGPTAVGLWKSDGTFLGSVTVPLGGGASVSNYNYVDLGSPIALTAGTSYRLAECVTNNVWFYSQIYPVKLDATVDGSYYTTTNGLGFPDANAGGAGNMYGPLSMKYTRVANVSVGGTMQVTGNSITSRTNSAAYFYGDGSGLTNVPAVGSATNLFKVVRDYYFTQSPNANEDGTLSNPFDGSTAAKLDGLANALLGTNTTGGTLHLLPGTFETGGLIITNDNWRIIGSGKDVTTVKMTNGAPAASIVFQTQGAIGGGGTLRLTNIVIANMTINACGTNNAGDQAHGVVIDGVGSSIHDVKVINAKGYYPDHEGFAIGLWSYTDPSINSTAIDGSGNTIYGNEVSSVQSNYVAAIGASDGAVFANEVILPVKTDTGAGNLSAYNCGGFKGLRLFGNHAFGGNYGFYCDTGAGTNLDLHDNMFQDVLHGISFNVHQASGVKVHDNTIVITTNQPANQKFAISTTTNTFNLEVYNNKIYGGDTNTSIFFFQYLTNAFVHDNVIDDSKVSAATLSSNVNIWDNYNTFGLYSSYLVQTNRGNFVGTFAGDGAGLTNVTATSTNTVVLRPGSNVTITTNVLGSDYTVASTGGGGTISNQTIQVSGVVNRIAVSPISAQTLATNPVYIVDLDPLLSVPFTNLPSGLLTNNDTRSINWLGTSNHITGNLVVDGTTSNATQQAGTLTFDAAGSDFNMGGYSLTNVGGITATGTFSFTGAGNGTISSPSGLLVLSTNTYFGGTSNHVAGTMANLPYKISFMATATDTNNTIRVPRAGTISSVDVYADAVTSCGVDVWKTNYVGYPPAVAGSITAGLYCTLSNTNHVRLSTLTGWTTTFSDGDYFTFNMVSNTAATKVHVDLNYLSQ